MRKTKKILATLAIVAMILTMIPVQAFGTTQPSLALNVSSVTVGQTVTITGTAIGTDGPLAGADVYIDTSPTGFVAPTELQAASPTQTTNAGTFSVPVTFNKEGKYSFTVKKGTITKTAEVVAKYNMTFNAPTNAKLGDTVTFAGKLVDSKGDGVVTDKIYVSPTNSVDKGVTRTLVGTPVNMNVAADGSFAKTVDLADAAIYQYGTWDGTNVTTVVPYGTFTVAGLSTLAVKAGKASVTGTAVTADQKIYVTDPDSNATPKDTLTSGVKFTLSGVNMTKGLLTLLTGSTETATGSGVYTKLVVDSNYSSGTDKYALDLSSVVFQGTGTVTVEATYEKTNIDTGEVVDYTGSTTFSVGAPDVLSLVAAAKDSNNKINDVKVSVLDNNVKFDLYNSNGKGLAQESGKEQNISKIDVTVSVPGVADDVKASFDQDDTKSNITVATSGKTTVTIGKLNPTKGGDVVVTVAAYLGTNAIPVTKTISFAVDGYKTDYNFGTQVIGDTVTPVVVVTDHDGKPVNNATVSLELGAGTSAFKPIDADGNVASSVAAESVNGTLVAVNNGQYYLPKAKLAAVGDIYLKISFGNTKVYYKAGTIVGTSTYSVAPQTTKLVAGKAEDVVIVAKDENGNLIKKDLTGYSLTADAAVATLGTPQDAYAADGTTVVGFKVNIKALDPTKNVVLTLKNTAETKVGTATITTVAPVLTVTPADKLLTVGEANKVTVKVTDPRDNSVIDISAGDISFAGATGAAVTNKVWSADVTPSAEGTVDLKYGNVKVSTLTAKPISVKVDANRLNINQLNTVTVTVADAHGVGINGVNVDLKQGTTTINSMKTGVDGKAQFSLTPYMNLTYTVVAKGVEHEIYAKDSNGLVSRVAGSDRVDTAIQMSRKGWASSSTVVIATAENFPDALAGGVLAGQNGAPILLNSGKTLDSAVAAEVQRLHASKAILLGGSGVVSDSVKTELESMGLTVTRYAGENRYQTAAAIGRAVGNSKQTHKAYIATGENFADALSVASFAAQEGTPIFLTDGATIDSATVAAIKDLGVTDVTIIGGTGVVSESVATALKAISGVTTVDRIGGVDRYDTATKVFVKLANNEASYILATGENFPDALAGAAFAKQTKSAMLLTSSATLTSGTNGFLTDNSRLVANLYVLGGAGAVSADVVNAVEKKVK